MTGQFEFSTFPENNLANCRQCSHEPDFFNHGGLGDEFCASCDNEHGNAFNINSRAQEVLPIKPALPATPVLPCPDLWNTVMNGLDLDDLPGLSNTGSDENVSTSSSPQQAAVDNHLLEDLDFDLLPSPMILMEPQRDVVCELSQPSKGKFHCAFCNSMFTHRYLLNRHTKIHTRPHKCTAIGCKWGFPSQKDLLRHQRTLRHRAAGSRKKDNIDAFLCTFPTCEYSSKGFSRRDNLQRHMSRVHCKTSSEDGK